MVYGSMSFAREASKGWRDPVKLVQGWVVGLSERGADDRIVAISAAPPLNLVTRETHGRMEEWPMVAVGGGVVDGRGGL